MLQHNVAEMNYPYGVELISNEVSTMKWKWSDVVSLILKMLILNAII